MGSNSFHSSMITLCKLKLSFESVSEFLFCLIVSNVDALDNDKTVDLLVY